MNDSFFAVAKESVFVAGSDNFASKISTGFASYGLTSAQATAYGTVNTTLQAAVVLANTPSTRTKSTVAAKAQARAAARFMASNLAKIIDGTPTVTDSMRIDLGLAVRGIPAPRPDPGTPNRFKAELGSDGSLTLAWKCNNPPRTSGTIYQVWRRIGATGEFQYLNGTGMKKFVDNTIPAGTSQITYQIQAVRSTAVGPWAQFNVTFGVTGETATVEEQAPMKMAA